MRILLSLWLKIFIGLKIKKLQKIEVIHKNWNIIKILKIQKMKGKNLEMDISINNNYTSIKRRLISNLGRHLISWNTSNLAPSAKWQKKRADINFSYGKFYIDFDWERL